MTSNMKTSLAVALLFCGISATLSCDPGMWGTNCTEVCGYCENENGEDVGCDAVTGDCPVYTDGTYNCKTGWKGFRCQEPICDHNCLEGKCIAPDTCFCGEDINKIKPYCNDLRQRGVIGSAIAVGVITLAILFCDCGSKWYKRNHMSKSER